jgi:hypothetical protein
MTICTGALGQNMGQARKYKHDDKVKSVGIRGCNKREKKNSITHPS